MILKVHKKYVGLCLWVGFEFSVAEKCEFFMDSFFKMMYFLQYYYITCGINYAVISELVLAKFHILVLF